MYWITPSSRNHGNIFFNSHTVLRTSFVNIGLKSPLQIVNKHIECEIQLLDFSKAEEENNSENLCSILEKERKQGFDMARAPLSRFVLIKKSENQHTFIWTHHHILFDGWCLPIIFKELIDNYSVLRSNKSTSLKLDKYEDFITYLALKDTTKGELFWKDYLAGFTSPTDLQMGKNLHTASIEEIYEKVSMKLSNSETQKLNNYARKQRITVNTIAQGAWAKLLQVYSGNDDVVFGVTVSGRPADLDGAEEKVGLFINTLPLRINTDKNQCTLDWLKEIQDQQLLLREHEHTPLTVIQGISEVPYNKNLFTCILVFENYPVGESGQENKVDFQIENIQTYEKTNYPLTIAVSNNEYLNVDISYNSKVYGRKFIEQLIGHF